MHDDAIATGDEASGRPAEFDVTVAPPTYRNEPREQTRTRARVPPSRSSSPTARAVLTRTDPVALPTTTTVAPDAPPIATDAKAIELVGQGIGSMCDTNRDQPI